MKSIRIIAFILVLAPLGASAFVENAGDVLLDRKHVSVDSDRAVVVRTADSPKVVKVEMSVPMGERVCEEPISRTVYGRDPSCGYDTFWDSRWVSYCVDWRSSPRGGNRCVRWHRRLERYPYSRMRSCAYSVPDCARWGTATRFEPRRVKLVFRQAAKLSGSEQETFELTAAQTRIGSGDADFKLKPLETKSTYRMKESDFFGDRIKAQRTGGAAASAQATAAGGAEASVEAVAETVR